MAVANAACPYCGQETLVTVPNSDTEVRKVKQSYSSAMDTEAACRECGKKFYAYHN